MGGRSAGPWIALAGLFVGAGLAVGLYLSRAPAAPSLPSSAPSPAMIAVDAAPVDVTAAARAAFEPLRQKWRKACWEPLVKSTPAPATSRHPISVGFDAGGNEIARSINEQRDGTRQDVAACLREQPFEPIHVPPTGVPASVNIAIEFP